MVSYSDGEEKKYDTLAINLLIVRVSHYDVT